MEQNEQFGYPSITFFIQTWNMMLKQCAENNEIHRVSKFYALLHKNKRFISQQVCCPCRLWSLLATVTSILIFTPFVPIYCYCYTHVACLQFETQLQYV